MERKNKQTMETFQDDTGTVQSGVKVVGCRKHIGGQWAGAVYRTAHAQQATQMWGVQ